MTLLVDLGNSRVKWARATGGGLASHGEAAWRESGIDSMLDTHWADLPAPARVVVCSVLDEGSAQVLRGWVAGRWGVEAEFVHSRSEACGVRNAYSEPGRLGADRFAALVAARALYGGACCVVDCGTAITLDALAGDGLHLGGLILPGITAMRRSLAEGTAGIRDVEGEPRILLARSTGAAVAAGTLYAVVALVDRVVADVASELAQPVACLVTGGDAAQVRPLLAVRSALRQDLVLHGLALLAGVTP